MTFVLDWEGASLRCRDFGPRLEGRVAAGPGRLVLSFTLLVIEFIGVIH